jgi:hypothetical protein
VRASGKHDNEMNRGVVVGSEDSIGIASFRLFFFAIIHSVYQTERLDSNYAPGPKSGGRFNAV